MAKVNNAGMAVEAETLEAALNRTISINTRGVFLGCKYAITKFLDSPQEANEREDESKGWIVNMASVMGIVGCQEAPAYITSKHAVVGMTTAITIDYGKDNNNCNALCPGFVETSMTEKLRSMSEGVECLESRHPWGKLRTPDDIAKTAGFLASENAFWVTGHALIFDGGYAAQ